MMESRNLKILIGAIVFFFIAFCSTYFVYGINGRPSNNQQDMVLNASFLRADGIKEGSSVRASGIEIGQVIDVKLTATYSALVRIMFFDQNIGLLDDTAAVIETDGIFGEKYIELYQGGSSNSLETGQRILYTQDSVILENILVQVLNTARNSE
tara:strand:+ start:895 stop:1356 length:462 start_codon:yes stop_codon:yes gene_type:complete